MKPIKLTIKIPETEHQLAIDLLTKNGTEFLKKYSTCQTRKNDGRQSAGILRRNFWFSLTKTETSQTSSA